MENKKLKGIKALAKDFIKPKEALIDQTWEVSEGVYKVRIKITPKHIAIVDEGGVPSEFVFASKNDKSTIERWKAVLRVMTKAIELAERKRK